MRRVFALLGDGLDNVEVENRRSMASISTSVGESGCGKSTLARIIVGIDRPDEGHVEHRGACAPR